MTIKNMSKLASLLIATLLKGYIFSKMWLWFVVPTFLLPPLSFVNAVGICGIVILLQLEQTVAIVWPQIEERILRTPGYRSTQEEWDRCGSLVQSLITIFVLYPMVLLLAWIVSRFL